jgi:hypothetical protein
MSHPFVVNRWTSSSTRVDYDTDDELDGRFAFCTHAHEDHLQGIERFGRPFFASPITKELIRLRSPIIPPGNIIALDYDWPYQLNRRLCVTMTDSGHCPGSSAFTFEGPSGNVLHTGDARWEPPTIAALPPRLSERTGYVDRIFLDATFGGRDVMLDSFPSRGESADLARRAIYSHSMQTHPHVDVAATMLGTEPLVPDLCDYFGVELYCEPSLRERRAQLEIALGENWLIDDPTATFIRLCTQNDAPRGRTPCPCGPPRNSSPDSWLITCADRAGPRQRPGGRLLPVLVQHAQQQSRAPGPPLEAPAETSHADRGQHIGAMKLEADDDASPEGPCPKMRSQEGFHSGHRPASTPPKMRLVGTT